MIGPDSMEAGVKIEIDIPDDQAELLAGWPIPGELCGPSVQDRVRYLITEQCDYLRSQEHRAARLKLHRMFGLRGLGDTDDEIDL